MGWRVRGSNPGEGEIFRTCPDRPWGPPSLLYNGYRVFHGEKVRPGRDTHPSPPSSAEFKIKSRAILLLSLRAFVTYDRVKPTLRQLLHVSVQSSGSALSELAKVIVVKIIN